MRSRGVGGVFDQVAKACGRVQRQDVSQQCWCGRRDNRPPLHASVDGRGWIRLVPLGLPRDILGAAIRALARFFGPATVRPVNELTILLLVVWAPVLALHSRPRRQRERYLVGSVNVG
jgi:hypothetical protein